MTPAAEAKFGKLLIDPTPPLPPMRMSYSDPNRGPFVRASELENYTDEHGLSCWRVKEKQPRD